MRPNSTPPFKYIDDFINATKDYSWAVWYIKMVILVGSSVLCKITSLFVSVKVQRDKAVAKSKSPRWLFYISKMKETTFTNTTLAITCMVIFHANTCHAAIYIAFVPIPRERWRPKTDSMRVWLYVMTVLLHHKLWSWVRIKQVS